MITGLTPAGGQPSLTSSLPSERWGHVGGFWHSLLHLLGIDDESGHWYAWWSGAGSDVGELAILGGIIGAWHKVNCHVKGCPRIGRHHVDGTTYVVCRHHHPEDKPTHHDVLAAYRQHQAKKDHH
jgi:hypothetical protein